MSKTLSSSDDFSLLTAFWNEHVERRVFANGLTVLIKPDHSAPVASVQVWVKTGSIHEDRLLGAGISHFLEHMLFKGTERRAGREISTTVQAHGGYINAYTTFDRTVYYIDLPSEHVNVALDLLEDAVLHSTLPEEEVVKERDVILREIDMGKDDPDHRLSEALFETAFRTHPFRYPIIGYKDVFETITRDDLIAYYTSRYVPNNLVVVVAGAVDVNQVAAEIERTFGQAPRRRLAPVLISRETEQLAMRELHRFEDVEVSRAGLAWPIPGVGHEDAPLLDLVSTILGGGESSVLWQSIRERQRLVHQIDAHSWTPGDAGLFYISFNSDPEKREAATEAIYEELVRVARVGFTDAQRRKAIRQMIVGEINSRKTMSGQAARLGAAEVVVGDLDFSRTFFAALQRATNADLKRVIAEYLVRDRVTAVSLNPESSRPHAAARVDESAKTGPAFEEINVANGARIVFQEDRHLPNVHIRFICKGGPLFEEASRRGTTALLANLLTKDTKKRSAAEVAEYIESVGGSFYPFSGNNSLGLAAEVLPTDLDRALELMSDALLQPAFSEETFVRERDAQVAELLQDEDDVVVFGRKLLRKKFFGTYPLFLDAAGDAASVKRLEVTDLKKIWKRCLIPANVVVSVAGDFDRTTLIPKIEALLTKLPKNPTLTSVPSFTGPAEVGNFEEIQPREQAVVYQAFPGPGLLDKDFYVSEVADELFSGMSSRLFERVREEKGLAYFVRSSRVTGLNAGMFMFFAGTSPKSYEEVLREIDAEIARVQAGKVESDELRRCQTRLKAGKRMGLQANSSRSMLAGLNSLFGLPLNDWVNYDRYIDEVSISSLQKFAKKYFQRKQRVQLVVRPEVEVSVAP